MRNHKMTCRNTLCQCSVLEITSEQQEPSGRRGFLKTAGGIGALGLAGGLSINNTIAADSGIIDTHHHFYSPSYMKAWVDYEVSKGLPHFPTQLAWTPEGAVAAMDKA